MRGLIISEKGKVFVAVILSLLCMTIASGKDYYFKHLGVSDGLSQICIPSIYQDELGVVWLGTTEGLNRYNGKEVKIFRPSQDGQGLTNNEINELCGDKKERYISVLEMTWSSWIFIKNNSLVYDRKM